MHGTENSYLTEQKAYTLLEFVMVVCLSEQQKAHTLYGDESCVMHHLDPFRLWSGWQAGRQAKNLGLH